MTPPDAAADSDFGELREQLVSYLRGAGHLESEPLADAFRRVPRHVFLPELAPERAYRDEPHPTKWSADGRPISSSSQPTIMAIMLEQLDLMPGQRVLEIGAGTGYNAALLRYLVGPAGRVTTVEIDAELARRARTALRRSGYAARVLVGDGREGFAAAAPYDRIIVTASVAEIPNAWLDQLRPGGRLELPLRLDADAVPHVIPALELRDGILQSVALTWGGFMALHNGDGRQPGPPPDLQVNQWAQGTHTFLLRITGPALDRLSDAARRRLVALVLADPRSRTSRGHVVTRWPAPPDLLLYLLQRVPDTRRIELHTPTRQAIGLVSPEGRSVAVASMRVPRLGKGSAPGSLQQPKRDRWWTETYGELDVTSELDHILEEWQTLRRSGRTRLHIEARRSSTSTTAEVHLAWKPRGHS